MEINFFNHTEHDTKEYEDLISNILKDFDSIMNIIFVDDDEIQEINKEYRNIDRVTDVISFALKDSLDLIDIAELDDELGDIFIDLDQAFRQAKEYGHSIAREVGFLAVHGYLHLNGSDHMTKEDEEVMFKRQEEILLAANLER